MRSFSLSLLVAAAAPLALAQEDVSPWEVEVDGDLAVVVALGMEEEAGDIAPQSGLWEASLGFGAERTLQSGTTIGARAVLRAARDHPARPAGTGNLALATAQGPAGAYSQLAFGPEFANQGARASLETAYLFVETGYGEFSFGRDTGVAARFQEGNISVLGSARLIDPYLDPSGIAALSTRPDVTGPSHKVSYVTPRLLGVRAGVSYTPEADIRGLDKDATGDPRSGRPGLEDVVEMAVNASRRLRESGVRLRGGAGYVTGEVTAPFGLDAAYEDRMQAFFAGGEVEWAEHYRFGFSWLSAEEALVGDASYTAWNIGLGYEFDGWDASLMYGESDLESLGGEADGVSFALRREISQSTAISVAYQDRSLDLAAPTGQSGDMAQPSRNGIVVEITLALEK